MLQVIKFAEKVSFFSLRLNVSVLVMAHRCSGRSFHALGAATLKRALQTSDVSLGPADPIRGWS